MRHRFQYVLLACCILFCACGKDRIGTSTEPMVKLELTASSAEIPENGETLIPFTVQGDLPDGTLSLRLRDGGTPQEFSLTGISPTDTPGLYLACIRDSGIAGAYSREVCIWASPLVHSDYICVNCGPASYPVAVETGLPVVYIDTDGGKGISSKTVSTASVLKIRGDGTLDGLPPSSCSVRGRGNISWKWPKKPYRLHFRDRVSLLGMPPHEDWVLLASFSDRTLMRSLVAMKVSSLTSLEWTPRCVPVELVLDGEHRGNYLLMEQLAVGADRLDLGDTGLLLELDYHQDGDFHWIDPRGSSLYRWDGVPFAVRYPDPEGLTVTQKEQIRHFVAQAAQALYGEDFADPDKGYAAWLDVDSFVDYWLVFEIMGNYELGNPGSVFMHKRADGKLQAGPCWDFDWSLLRSGADIQDFTGLLNRDAIWYSRLFRDPAFAQKVRTRFEELLPSLQQVPAYIEVCTQLLSESARLNFAMWNPEQDRWRNKGLPVNGDESLGFEEAAKQLSRTYLDRLALMQKLL